MNATLKMAASATLHCLMGCAVGEILGMMIGAQFGWTNMQTVALAFALAFVFGYAFSTIPLLRNGMRFWSALKLVFIADSLSILTMEIVDNAIMLLIPGAVDAHFLDLFFWASMTLALCIAFLAAWPVNYYLLKRGKGHALTHHHMHGEHSNGHHHHEH